MLGMAPKNDRVVSATLRVPTLLVLQELEFNSTSTVSLNRVSNVFCFLNIDNLYMPGDVLPQVQWVHEPADLWDITFCTYGFLGFKYYWHQQILR